MDWLKSILQILPLEKISDILGEIVIWWSQMVKNVPPADLPMYAYLGGSIVVLALWILVARILPRPLGGMSWMILFAVLLAPGTALGDPSLIAPASISVVYAIMMKDTATAITSALPVLVVLVAGLFIGFVWQLIRGAFESSLDKARRSSANDTEANMQLATGNYLAESQSPKLEENLNLAKYSDKQLNERLPAEVISTPVNLEKRNSIEAKESLKAANSLQKEAEVNITPNTATESNTGIEPTPVIKQDVTDKK